MAKVSYLNLIRELALTDFKLKYNGSVFGYLWSLVKPLFLFLVLYLVFVRIFKVGANVPNFPIYLLLGVVLWGFFAEATNVCMQSIVSRGDLIRKLYFPRIILTISSIITTFITLILNLFIVFVFAVYVGIDFNKSIFLLPVVLIEFCIFSLGVSFFLATFFVKFRDISHIWEIISQALFYLTPVLYPLSLVPAKYLSIIMSNPLAQIIQDARKILISPDIQSSSDILGAMWFVPHAITIITFVVGYFMFQKMAAKFAEDI